MRETEALVNALEHADGTAQTFAACCAAFEFTQRTATAFAVPDTQLFRAFLSVIPAACEGRDLAVSAPSMPSTADTIPEPLTPDTTHPDTAADALAELANVITRKLTEAAETPASEADQQAIRAATGAAAEIAGLLRG